MNNFAFILSYMGEVWISFPFLLSAFLTEKEKLVYWKTFSLRQSYP